MLRLLIWIVCAVVVLPALYDETHSTMLVCVIGGIYLRFVFEDVINPYLDKLKESLES